MRTKARGVGLASSRVTARFRPGALRGSDDSFFSRCFVFQMLSDAFSMSQHFQQQKVRVGNQAKAHFDDLEDGAHSNL